MEEIKTPTLEKIKAIQRESELFGKFLDWLLQRYTVFDRKQVRDSPFADVMGAGDYINAGVLLDTLQFALPSIAFGLTVTLYYSLSRAFGHGFGYTVGIMFLPFIFVLLLGVGRSRYTRPDKYRDKF